MKILIVDDHPKIRESLKKFFHLERIESEEARTGQEALDKIRSSCYDLCILDMNMPIMSGREFLKIIRQKRTPLKVLVLTADSRTEDTVEALNLGADDYLRKPFSFDELLARVRALTRRHEQVTLEIEEYGPYLIDLGNRHISENHIKLL